MKKFLFLLISALTLTNAYSQNVAINATGSLPDNSAMLDVSSTTKGFLPPRMTLSQRNLINLPATGIIIYQIDVVNGLYVNQGTSSVPNWKLIGPAVPVASPSFFFNTDQSVFSFDYIGLGSSGPDFLRNTSVVPVACVLKSIAFSTRGPAITSQTATVWRQTPGNPPETTNLSAFILPGTITSVTSGAVAVNAGDLISVRITISGNSLTNGVAVSVAYQ